MQQHLLIFEPKDSSVRWDVQTRITGRRIPPVHPM